MVNTRCSACRGLGVVWSMVVDCDQIVGHSCDHITHFTRRRCVRCLGSRRADVFTLLWRWMRS